MSEEDEDCFEDSGPYCRHWSDPAECEECRAGCAHCGCSGVDHSFQAEGKCDNCPDCPGWEDKE